jgi:hypothetical protein
MYLLRTSVIGADTLGHPLGGQHVDRLCRTGGPIFDPSSAGVEGCEDIANCPTIDGAWRNPGGAHYLGGQVEGPDTRGLAKGRRVLMEQCAQLLAPVGREDGLPNPTGHRAMTLHGRETLCTDQTHVP